MGRHSFSGALWAAPAIAFFLAFWLLPMARLISVGASGEEGARAYLDILTHPDYLRSFIATTLLSVVVTASTLCSVPSARYFWNAMLFLAGSCWLPC